MGFSARWNKAYSGFSEALLDCGEQLTKQGEIIMTHQAEKFLTQLDENWPRPGGDHDHPWWTGTLHDSIAVRVADKSRTIALRFMEPDASRPQTATEEETGIRDYDKIVGTVYGRITAARGSRVRQSGTVAQLFVGVPYAQRVNADWKHEGFLDEMNTQFISFMEDAFSPNGNYYFRNLIVRPRK